MTSRLTPWLLAIALGGCTLDTSPLADDVPSPDAGIGNRERAQAGDHDVLGDPDLGLGDADHAQSNWLHPGTWPNGIVPYYISMADCPGGDEEAFRARVEAGVAAWNDETRLVLVPYEPGSSASRLKFLCNRDSKNMVFYPGYPGANDTRTVHLNETGRDSTVIHEIGHAIGLMHEHQRSDRGGHVRVFFESITDTFANDFWKCDICSSLGSPYDHDSIMHYSSKSNSDGFVTLLRRDEWSISTFNDDSYEPCLPAAGNALDELADIRIGDFDGDGDDDLLRYDDESGRFQVSYVDVSGPTMCSEFVDLSSRFIPIDSMSEVDIGDFDDDDVADIFIADGESWRFLESEQGWAFQNSVDIEIPKWQVTLGVFEDDPDDSGFLFVANDGRMFIGHRSTSGVEWSQTVSNDSGTDLVYDDLYFRPKVGDIVGNDGIDDIVLWNPLAQMVSVVDGGFGVRTSYYAAESWFDWHRVRLLAVGSSAEILTWWSAGKLFQIAADTRDISLVSNTPSVTEDPHYFKAADFNGNGRERDILLHGWIPRRTELSKGDIANVESVYGPCTNTVKQRYTNCTHPMELVQTVSILN